MAPAKEAVCKCPTCDKNITKSKGSVQCIICSLWFHLDCADVSERQYAALKESNSLFHKCGKCTITLKSHDDDEEGAGEIRSLHLKMDRILNRMEEDKENLNAKFGSVVTDIKKEFSTTFAEIRCDIAKCNKNIKIVESAAGERIAVLEAENNSLHRRINRSDIIINGLPYGLQCIPDCVVAIGAVYNVTLSKSDINNAFYINKGKSVIVKFNSVFERDSIMRAYFKSRNLKLCDVIGGDITSRVFLNDHMTPATSKLNALCRRLIKEKKIKKYWLMHADVPKVRLTHPDDSVGMFSYEECLRLLEDIQS